jgi:hypothetical protein
VFRLRQSSSAPPPPRAGIITGTGGDTRLKLVAREAVSAKGDDEHEQLATENSSAFCTVLTTGIFYFS